jgi:hypothetical protein
MPLINVPVGIAPCQIDDFPSAVGKGKDARPFERSCEGAMHLRPASTKTVTQDEIDWIKAHKDHKALAQRMRIVRVDVMTDDTNRSTAMPVEKPSTDAVADPQEKPSADAVVDFKEKPADVVADSKGKASSPEGGKRRGGKG